MISVRSVFCGCLHRRVLARMFSVTIGFCLGRLRSLRNQSAPRNQYGFWVYILRESKRV